MSTQELLLAAVILGVPLVAFAAGVIVQWFRTMERLRAIEKGVPLDQLPSVRRSPRVLSPAEQAANVRLGGLICIATGVGLLVLFAALATTIPQFPAGVVAVAAVPFCVGVALLMEYRVRRRESEARERSGLQ